MQKYGETHAVAAHFGLHPLFLPPGARSKSAPSKIARHPPLQARQQGNHLFKQGSNETTHSSEAEMKPPLQARQQGNYLFNYIP
eukprot:scaffold140021_cov20-Tisochrysis_lutea.AAC.1